MIFSYIALPGTYLNGTDISYASKEDALSQAKDDFKLHVAGRDGRSLDITPKDIDFKQELPKKAKIDQNPFMWPVSMASGRKEYYDFEYKTFFNEEKLDKIIDDSQLVNGTTEPEDAKLVVEDGLFKIQEEVMGNKLDKTKLKREIIDGINTKTSEITLADDIYYSPKITKDSQEIKDILEDANELAHMSLKFNFNGFDFKLEGKSLLDLCDLTDNGYELNYDKVRAYVENMAEETNTYGKQRTFNATGIGEVVVGPGVYGFKLDNDRMIDKIYELVNAREAGEIEPVYTNVGYARYDDGSDLGDTYIELDISRQYVWFYKDGELILESPTVTGLPTERWASNVGVGAILNKVADTTLEGLEFNEVDSYKTPVKYWIPTGWDGEGFHDAPWRSAFGGEIYRTNGSHGCYNMPPEVAGQIFEQAEYMTPVVVYESSTNDSPAMAY